MLNLSLIVGGMFSMWATIRHLKDHQRRVALASVGRIGEINRNRFLIGSGEYVHSDVCPPWCAPVPMPNLRVYRRPAPTSMPGPGTPQSR